MCILRSITIDNQACGVKFAQALEEKIGSEQQRQKEKLRAKLQARAAKTAVQKRNSTAGDDEGTTEIEPTSISGTTGANVSATSGLEDTTELK